jgi:hypothetical protein
MLHPLDWDDDESATKKHDVASRAEPVVPSVRDFAPLITIMGLPVIGVHGVDEEPDSSGNLPLPIAIRKLHIASPPRRHVDGDVDASAELEAIEGIQEIVAIEELAAAREELEPVSWEEPDDMTQPQRSDQVSEVIRCQARALAYGSDGDFISLELLPEEGPDAHSDEEPATNREEEPATNRAEKFCAKDTVEMPRVEGAELALEDIRSTMQMAKVTLPSQPDEGAFAHTKRAPALEALDAAESYDTDEESEDSGEIDVDLETSDVISVAGLLPSRESPSVTLVERASDADEIIGRRALTSSLPPMTMTPAEPSQRESRWNKFAGISSALVLVAMAAALVISLMPTTGGLRVELANADGVAPAKAEIFVDGQKKCDTEPCIIEGLSPGARTIKVLVPGVKTPATAIAIVNAGETSPIKVTVAEPEPEPVVEAAKPAKDESKKAASKTDPKKATAARQPKAAKRPRRRVSRPPPVEPAPEELDVSGSDIYED